MHQSFETREQRILPPTYTDLNPDIQALIDDRFKVCAKYKHADSDLFVTLGKLEGNNDFSQGSLALAGLSRNPGLEERPALKDLADYNYKEMERATSLRWYLALNQLFNSEHFNQVQMKNPNQGLKIAVPGCHLGFEIGGALDFFNKQGIKCDIEAADIGSAGQEKQFMNLEKRKQVLGSEVNFHSNTDARDFYRDKDLDLVILRHPGFVFEPDQYHVWKEIVDVVAKSKPGLMIVSDYNHSMNDEYFAAEVVGLKGRKKIFEGQVFDKLLADRGYNSASDYNAWLTSELLRYPLSPYMLAFKNEGGRLIFDVPVDLNIRIYGSEEYLRNSKVKAK